MPVPDVSVILPVHNGARHLREAVESVLAQHTVDFELLILNDGSTDNTHEILQPYLSDPRIRYFSRENRGLGSTLNELASLARAPLVARMDADDICFPDRLALQFSLLQARTDVGMCGTDIVFLADGLSAPSMGVTTDHQKIVQALNAGRFPLCHPTVMFRKVLFDRIGGYRVKGAGEDLDLFLRFSELSILTNVDAVLLKYRIHADSLSVNNSSALVLGYGFAIDCARRRRRGQPELTYAAFAQQLKGDYISLTLSNIRYALSERIYRKSIVSRAHSRPIQFFLYAAAVSIMRPSAALRRISDLLRGASGRGGFRR